MEEHIKKWRLILGEKSDPGSGVPLTPEEKGMDDVLEALYNTSTKGGLGASSPNINRWLGDIRRYFPTPMVQIMQKDALERLGLKQMLLEPELLNTIKPDVELVSTLLTLQKIMPEKTRETAREVVRKLVKKLEQRLSTPMREAIKGSLSKQIRNRNPRINEIDWRRTIHLNLKHYQRELRTIIPAQLIGFGKRTPSLKHILLLIDQSGSMASSVVYSGIFGSILASLRSVKTNLIAFDTSVVDLTAELNDPVDLLFGIQLGGGTDINQALSYAQKLVINPAETIMVLLTDLFEGGQESTFLKRAANIKSSGVQLICLLSLNDEGAPVYNRDIARQLAVLDIPSFACTPDLFPELMAAAIRKKDIRQWMGKKGIRAKS